MTPWWVTSKENSVVVTIMVSENVWFTGTRLDDIFAARQVVTRDANTNTHYTGK